MENQNSKKKKLINIAVLAFVVIAVVSAFLLGGIGKNVSANDGIIVYDSDGAEIACLNLKKDEIETTLINNEAAEYVELVINEALEKYAEITDEEDFRKAFFNNTKAVNTNLDTDVLGKIISGYGFSTLNTEVSFASVVTDINGKVLAIYGKGSEDGVVYSDKKTYAGSAIKPLSVYAPAIQSGKAHWSSTVIDSPVKKITDESGLEYDWPSNANGTYTNEPMLLCDAVHKSINTVAVKVLRSITVEKSIGFLENNLGFDIEYEKNLAEAKGGDEVLGNLALGYLYNGVSALDMAGYYQIFANGGYYTEPYTVSSIEDREGEIFTFEPKKKRVISPQTASVMTQLLKGVVYPGGTATAAYSEKTDVAGKSGTSDRYEDNWFVGYTPEYICSVWHSRDAERKNKAASVFADIMKDMPVKTERFKISDDVKLKFFCRKTGLLQGKGCIDVVSGYYASRIPGKCGACR